MLRFFLKIGGAASAGEVCVAGDLGPLLLHGGGEERAGKAPEDGGDGLHHLLGDLCNKKVR